MMDYVELIKHVRYNFAAMQSPCIVAGGSYGGMLAAWLRMKFPFVFQGALAASAPILYFRGSPTAPEPKFNDIITESYFNVDPKCKTVPLEAWNLLMDIKTNRPSQWATLSTILKTCAPVAATGDIDNLYYHL
jgi:lysosomal Pro-X carboxypeptidase